MLKTTSPLIRKKVKELLKDLVYPTKTINHVALYGGTEITQKAFNILCKEYGTPISSITSYKWNIGKHFNDDITLQLRGTDTEAELIRVDFY